MPVSTPTVRCVVVVCIKLNKFTLKLILDSERQY